MKSWIIVIGNEILIGRVLDTNSNWIAKKLTELGIKVERILVIPDEEETIVDVLKEACRHADIIISTGGLGPTYDDITSEALAKALNQKWVVNKEALNMVKQRLKRLNLELNEYRIKMAKMPEKAKPLENKVGVAPGIYVEYNNSKIFALPGVPSEMKHIYLNHVEKILKRIFKRKYYREDKIRVKGYTESTLAPILNKIVTKYPDVYVKSHPLGVVDGKPVIDIVVASYGNDEGTLKNKNITIINEIRKRLDESKKT